MKTNDWDKELAEICRDLGRLDQILARTGRVTGRVAQRKLKFVQAQLRFERICDQMQKILERDFIVLPHEKAILHWSKIYLEKVKEFYQIRQKTMTRGLWVKLLRVRLLGTEHSDEDLRQEPEAEDLITLAVRYSQLQKSEQQLKSTLATFQKRKGELHRQYQLLEVIQANGVAGRSFQLQGGTGVKTGGANMAFVMLGHALQKAGRYTQSDDNMQIFAQYVTEFLAKAEETLESCHSLTLAQMNDSLTISASKMQENLGLAVQNLATMDAQAQQMFDDLSQQTIPSMHPIFVQKDRIKDKRVVAGRPSLKT